MNHLKLFKLDTSLLLSKRTRVIFFIISIALVAVSGILTKTYRPYIYANHIFDYHFADSFSDLFAVPAAACIFLALTKRVRHTAVYYGSVFGLGYVLYEFIGLTFDYYDMLAAVISGIITSIVLSYVFKQLRLASTEDDDLAYPFRIYHRDGTVTKALKVGTKYIDENGQVFWIYERYISNLYEGPVYKGDGHAVYILDGDNLRDGSNHIEVERIYD